MKNQNYVKSIAAALLLSTAVMTACGNSNVAETKAAAETTVAAETKAEETKAAETKAEETKAEETKAAEKDEKAEETKSASIKTEYETVDPASKEGSKIPHETKPEAEETKEGESDAEKGWSPYNNAGWDYLGKWEYYGIDLGIEFYEDGTYELVDANGIISMNEWDVYGDCVTAYGIFSGDSCDFYFAGDGDLMDGDGDKLFYTGEFTFR